MLPKNLFEKYENIKYEPPFNLFGGIDWDAVRRENKCPWGHKLYAMRDKPYVYCKSKKHKRFVIKKWG